jgi:hypothetical protein
MNAATGRLNSKSVGLLGVTLLQHNVFADACAGNFVTSATPLCHAHSARLKRRRYVRYITIELFCDAKNIREPCGDAIVDTTACIVET